MSGLIRSTCDVRTAMVLPIWTGYLTRKSRCIIVIIVENGWSLNNEENNFLDILVEAYIGRVCFVVLMVCSLYRIFSNKCPYCGKLRVSNGEYCSYCGKKIDG